MDEEERYVKIKGYLSKKRKEKGEQKVWQSEHLKKKTEMGIEKREKGAFIWQVG